MAIIQNLTVNQFIDTFQRVRPTNFSPMALERLYDHLERLSLDTGKPVEIDPIGICSIYSEYSDIEEYNEENGTEYEDAQDVDEFAFMIDDSAFIAYLY
jgi:hypothetical protein